VRELVWCSGLESHVAAFEQQTREPPQRGPFVALGLAGGHQPAHLQGVVEPYVRQFGRRGSDEVEVAVVSAL
jgi:hypothetical protein